MKVSTQLRPLTIREISVQLNRQRELEIIKALPVELVKPTKMCDGIFNMPIPNFLRFKS